MANNIGQLADQHGLSYCVECGKCVAACPMGEIFADFSYEFSPRGVVEAMLLGQEVTRDDRLWFCLTCDRCTDLCPAGVRFRDFIEAVRQLVIGAGNRQYGVFCRDCGTYLWPRHTVAYLMQALGEESEDLLTLCPRCRQYGFGEKVKSLMPGDRRVDVCRARTGDGR